MPQAPAGLRIEPPPSPARRDRRGRAARGAADDAIGIPGVAGRAESLGLGRRGEAELGCIRLADEHEARAPEARRQLAVVGRDPAPIAQHARPRILRSAGEGRAEILQQDRHTAEGPVAERAAVDLLARRVEEREHDGVDLLIDALDPRDRLLEQLARGAGAAADQLPLTRRVEVGDARHRGLPAEGTAADEKGASPNRSMPKAAMRACTCGESRYCSSAFAPSISIGCSKRVGSS